MKRIGSYLIQLTIDFTSSNTFSRSRPKFHIACGTDIFKLNATSEYLPTFNLAITGQFPFASASLFLR